jgi:cysteine dioxygenase
MRSWNAIVNEVMVETALSFEARAELLTLRPDPAPGEPYGRRPLRRDELGEVMLAGWGEIECAPHDHAGGEGKVHVLEGSFTETEWVWREGVLRRGAVRRWTAGDAIPVAAGTIHSMTAHDRGTTLHVYRPAISGMQVFDPVRQETLSVRDDCGAWIPRDDGMILSRFRWEAGR